MKGKLAISSRDESEKASIGDVGWWGRWWEEGPRAENMALLDGELDQARRHKMPYINLHHTGQSRVNLLYQKVARPPRAHQYSLQL
jgi:hypothetical protein